MKANDMYKMIVCSIFMIAPDNYSAFKAYIYGIYFTEDDLEAPTSIQDGLLVARIAYKNII